jgi:AcrR family transcriptional regulator
MRRTKAEAEQTREAVIAAAVTVFLERGFARATFDEIARAAGVTRGAVYWHFRDKLEIFHALERRADLPNEAFASRLRARFADDRGLDPLHELARTIRDGVQAFEANTERCRILTILWLRCEYVGEMLPALERRRGDAGAFRRGHCVGGRARPVGTRMVARNGGPRPAPVGQRNRRVLAARDGRRSAGDRDDVAGDGVSGLHPFAPARGRRSVRQR